MKTALATLAALGLGLAALPALAGGIAPDLPRLEFPAPVAAPGTTGADATRGCTLPLLPGAPAACASAAN